jgi:hypothetical protein
MSGGTNNGGGALWHLMERRACPVCGLVKPTGALQVERNGGRCNNSKKCAERARRKGSSNKRGLG